MVVWHQPSKMPWADCMLPLQASSQSPMECSLSKQAMHSRLGSWNQAWRERMELSTPSRQASSYGPFEYKPQCIWLHSYHTLVQPMKPFLVLKNWSIVMIGNSSLPRMLTILLDLQSFKLLADDAAMLMFWLEIVDLQNEDETTVLHWHWKVHQLSWIQCRQYKGQQAFDVLQEGKGVSR